MSNLIRYIIQEDPEKQMRKNDLDYAKYPTWAPVQKQSQEDKYKGYKFSSKNLLENSFNSLTANKSSQSKDEGSLMGGISNIFNNIKSDEKSSSNASLPQSIAKTTTEESSKIGNVLSPKSIGNDAVSYKIAQDAKGNIANNAKANQTDYSLYGNDFSKEFIDKMTNDKEYQRALKEYAIPNEGGYINAPQDPGGETKFGIAKRYHPNEDILNLTRERANAFLYKEIWNWNGINTLPPEIKGFVFDHGIRTSPQNAIETTHRALGIDPVGDIIGKTTLGKLKETDYNEFLRKYKELVREQDKKRSGYGKFGKGWDNRTERYHISY